MSSNFNSMTALLGMLAVAGYENRDKIGELLHSAMAGAAPGAAPMPAPAPAQAGGLGGLLGTVLSSLAGGSQPAAAQQGGLGGLGGLLGGLLGGQQAAAPQGGLGGLGGLLGSLTGGNGADTGSVLSGGLGQLVQELQKNGLGDQAASWVSTGPNQDVTPQQLGQAIDPQILAGITQATGLNANDLLERLAQVLPKAVDSMTPTGSLPHA